MERMRNDRGISSFSEHPIVFFVIFSLVICSITLYQNHNFGFCKIFSTQTVFLAVYTYSLTAPRNKYAYLIYKKTIPKIYTIYIMYMNMTQCLDEGRGIVGFPSNS